MPPRILWLLLVVVKPGFTCFMLLKCLSIFLYIFISFQRLESFDFKASVGDGDDENAEKRWGVAGLLYGLGVPHLSRHSVVLNASGKVLEEEQIKGGPCSANLITWKFEILTY